MFDIVSNNNKVIHFIGLGGIGVSGLAEILHAMGCSVKGSDRSHSQNIDRLEKLGIPVFIGHDPNNIGDADIVVYSSAIKQDNPELLYAREHKIPTLSRAEMLSQVVRFKKSIVIAGSHGKTTVTSLCASILEMASFSPTVVNGGVINSYKTNARLGDGDWAIIESDESDGSFVHFFPTIGIITNIDHEHINHYGSFENLKTAFSNFIKNTPFYGCCIVCVDDANVLDVISNMYDRRIVRYALDNDDANYKAFNVRKNQNGTIFDVRIRNSGQEIILHDFHTPFFGDHNIRNALSAIAMANELNISNDIVRTTISGFTGVGRRFTHVGNISGVKVIDDYAHHPTEIKAVLNSAHQATEGKVAIICQPHRFSRLNNLFDDFVNALSATDVRIITSVYKADDSETGELDSTDLFNALSHLENTHFAEDECALSKLLSTLIDAGEISTSDIILFAGAGSVSKWAYNICREKNIDA